MASSREILQSVRNKIDTSHSGWSAFAEACIPPYEEAFNTHKTTLANIDKALKRDAEIGWMMLGMALSIVGGFWVPRLLTPFGRDADALVQDWVKTTFPRGLAYAGEDVAKEFVTAAKGTILENIKGTVISDSSSAYTPIVEETLTWSARLKQGIHERAYLLERNFDQLIDNADGLSTKTARFIENSFLTSCPFITDVPQNIGESFKKDFGRLSELTMWRAWGLDRDEKWWKKNPDDSDLLLMGSIFDRLIALGIAPNEIANYQSWSGTSLVNARRPGWRFDMLKFIQWSKLVNINLLAGSAKKADPPPQVCRMVDQRLFLRRSTNACYPNDIQ